MVDYADFVQGLPKAELHIHPLKRTLDLGLLVTVNSDDPGLLRRIHQRQFRTGRSGARSNASRG